MNVETTQSCLSQVGLFIIRYVPETCYLLPGALLGGRLLQPGDIASQTEAILDKFEYILKENGGSLENVVKVTSFVTDLREAPAAGEVRLKRFAGAFPVSTQVQVAALGAPDLKIEIDAIAILPD
ncbi:MAG: hypothetical protein CM1200mP35_07260 [Chloroflexota bacterium]|nr:MAG: hypothetical protein CM1200mP35_07260 [Chloroflexota bacterium]